MDTPRMEMDIDSSIFVETTGEQREIWNSCQFDPLSTLCFNESITLKFSGVLNETSLFEAINQVAQRHSSLRSTFSKDGIYMIVHDHKNPEYREFKYKSLRDIETLKEEEAKRIFDLEKGPLFRATLIRPEGDGDTYLILSAHHIICDGWSWAIITHDLGHFYNAHIEQVYKPLDLADQYWKYANYKNQLNSSEDLNYWKDIFSVEQQVIDYNNSAKRPEFRTFQSARLDTRMKKSTIIELRKKARSEGVTLYQYLLTSFFHTLEMKTKKNDHTVGISQAGQTNPSFSSVVGHCVGLLPIRLKYDSSYLDYSSKLQMVKKVILAAQKHSQVSFGEICEAVSLKRDPSRIPLVPITFNLDIQPVGQGLQFNNLSTSFTTNPRYYENFEMFINFTLIGDEATIENQYNTDLYSSEEVDNLQSNFISFLDFLAKNGKAEEFNFDFDYHSQPSSQSEIIGLGNDSSQKDHVTLKKDDRVENTAGNTHENTDEKEHLKDYKDLYSILSHIWQEVLHVPEIKAEDGFFSLGGHSLLVTQVLIKIENKLSIKLSMKDLFLNQKFSSFVDIVLQKKLSLTKKENKPQKSLVEPQSKSKVEVKSLNLQESGLSHQQKRTWLFQKLNSESSLFNLPSLFEFYGDLDQDLFLKAIERVIDSHILLQSSLQENRGRPYWQREEDSLSLECIDLNALYPNHSRSEVIKELTHKHTKEANTLMPLANRLYDFKIYSFKDRNRPNDTKKSLFLAQKIHHIIWDGWCYDIFLSELEFHYQELLAGRELKKSLDINYFDYVSWQNELSSKESYKESLNYWKKEFKTLADPLELPMKSGHIRKTKEFNGKSFIIVWQEEEIQPLEAVAKKEGTTLYNLLLCAFKLFLIRYSGQYDIVVGTPLRGRDRENFDKIIGFFVNNVAIRTQINSDMTVAECLKAVSYKTAMAFEHGLIPFDEVVRHSPSKELRDNTRTPLYQAFFMYQDATNRNPTFNGLEINNISIPREICHTDIDFWARRDKQGMKGGFDFDCSLFSHSQMEQMADDFQSFLKEWPSLYERRESWEEAQVISQEHKKKLLEELNPAPILREDNKNIADLIESVSKRMGNKKAISSALGSVSYEQLNLWSDSFAQYLMDRGIRPGDCVGMALSRTHYLPICLLGLIKAGAGYIPIDPSYPKDRIEYMIEHSKMKTILCENSDNDRDIFNHLEKMIITDPLSNCSSPLWNTEPSHHLKQRKNERDLSSTCYVIYTSGSTGKPKGVDISHRSMVNFLDSMIKEPGLKESDTLIAVTTMSFDIAVLEIYAPLLSGAHVYICSREEALFGDQLLDIMKEYKASVLQATPATWRQLLSVGLKNYPHDLKALCGGEALAPDLKNQLLESVNELWNMYGPTETTVWSSCHQINQRDNWISIGRPIQNTEILILNDHLKLCPYGAIGEICIAGDGLAKGYFNRDDLTQERFVFFEGRRVYRTGDLGRYRDNGLIECLGRNDGQVKVRGYRIELGEIESVLAKISFIKSQVVMVREDRVGDARIVAYYIKDKSISSQENESQYIREQMSQSLPPYMIPTHFVELDEFPLTLNGKIDRKKLPAPFQIGGEVEQKVSSNELKKEDSSQGLEQSEEILKRIWCRCLGVSDVKDSDDFFSVGGHSLLSVELFSQIESELNLSLPLSFLFESSTFGELKNKIFESESHSHSVIQKEYIENENISEVLVPMRVGKESVPNKKAIFLFHGVGGNILNYKKILRFIPNEFDVYGLQCPGVLGQSTLASSILELAILYANDISLVNSNGNSYESIYFAGGSMGGLLAFETAKEMQEFDLKVENVIMFDTFGPQEAFSHIPSTQRQSLLSRIKTFLYYRCKKWEADFFSFMAQLKGRPVSHKYRHFLVELNNYSLINQHKVSEGDIKVHLLRGEVTDEGHYSVKDLGWGTVAKKGVEIYTVTGKVNHSTFVESTLAGKELRKILEKKG
ncbi:MAG: hypothetical protein CME63_11650 [Halobacteriovoraceae bacterium]|nr:hypothetical protein [Halobacteriovoraceae bacterium]